MEYAGFWRRSVAMSIDGILLGVVQADLTIGLIGSLATEENGEEEALGEARALDRLEELLGDDHVGIDVDHPHRRGATVELGELVHDRLPQSRSRASAR